MRILMVSDVFFPRVNGVSTSIQTFLRELTSQGHEVTLIAPDYDQVGIEDDLKSDIIRIPSRRVPMDPEDRMMQMSYITALVDELRERKFDLIHIHTPFIAHYAGLRLAKALVLPVVESYHTYFEEYLYNYIRWLPQEWLRALAREFSRRQCNHVDAVVVPSEPMADVLRGYSIESCMYIVPTGINLPEFTDSDGRCFRQKHDIAQDRPVLIYIGRLAHEKNILFLLDVLKKLKPGCPDVLLILAGEGPAIAELKDAADARSLNDNILFVGYQQRGKALNSCYRAGNVFIFASRTETQGLVLLESMALGVPVLSTAIMGTRDVLSEGYGCMIADEDADSFAKTALWLLENPGVRALMADSGRQYAQRWSAPVMASRLLNVYTESITRKQSGIAELALEQS